MIEKMQNNVRSVHTDIATLVYYMKGGVDINDAYNLSFEQRKILQKIIEKDFEAQSGKKNSRLI
jgi:hypothetical protein